MGNNASSPSAQGHQQPGRKPSRTHGHSAAAASLASFQAQAALHRVKPHPHQQRRPDFKGQSSSGHFLQQSGISSSPALSPSGQVSGDISDPQIANSNHNRRRKSIELPDLDPKLAFTSAQTDSPGAAPAVKLNTPTSSRVKSHGMKDLTGFKLRLPEGIHRMVKHIDMDSRENTPVSGIEAMRLDVGDDHPGLGAQGAKADVEGTQAKALTATASTATPVPLPQPIETVVPPLPPTIIKPFPPPLPVESVVTGSTTAAANKVAAAMEAVRQAPALDLGAGPAGVPTLITWKEPATEVYVTGTFSRWKQQVKLRKNPEAGGETDFSALILLSPGPHRLKFIVDKKWKTSKYLPSATDAAGNLINYLQVNPGDQPFRGLGPRGMWSGYTYGNWQLGQMGNSNVLDPHDSDWHDNDDDWSSNIPQSLIDYEELFDNYDERGDPLPPPSIVPVAGQKGFSTEPPKLPAQLREGILNMGSKALESVTDDDSLLPKPDHSVLNHLAASPIKNEMLSVAVTTRFRRKYLTTVYFKPILKAEF